METKRQREGREVVERPISPKLSQILGPQRGRDSEFPGSESSVKAPGTEIIPSSRGGTELLAQNMVLGTGSPLKV
jgi:hypothetical protein